ncbi:cell division cycle-associated 7-like protein [Polyodon spathula]|uniref:cell division cycle-associated 7-like protein n=1 Tax=Polyodon spathula TaxID=7913 RepID=UPI001B7F148F|nr:cell division cycle-associated 7-like protein [Polyodon spathula]
MPVSTKVPKALLQIFETQSDDEDFKGFRNSLPIETSSEDSWDSIQSLDWVKGVSMALSIDLCFRSMYITEELVKVFTEDIDSKDEEFEGFTEGDLQLNDWMKSMSMDSGSEEDISFSSDDEQEVPPKKSVSGLCVAFKFPVKKTVGTPLAKGKKESLKSEEEEEEEENRKGKAKPQPQRAHSDSEPEEDCDNAADQPNTLQKRAKNIKENKDMLAKLLAELNSMPDLFHMKTPSTTPKQKKSLKNFPERQSGRRNPSRRARPPERFGLEGFSMLPTKLMEQLNSISRRAAMRKTKVNDEEMSSGSPKKRFSKHSDQRSVEDITEEELENVAISFKDKLYDKINGSTCHQCRQKTTDSKTVCRNSSCWGVRGQFCGPCLRNRYGEDVQSALLDPLWVCPPGRGVCNCSFCRRRDGRCATGILIHMAKFYGHDNVKEYLESVQKELSLEK